MLQIAALGGDKERRLAGGVTREDGGEIRVKFTIYARPRPRRIHMSNRMLHTTSLAGTSDGLETEAGSLRQTHCCPYRNSPHSVPNSSSSAQDHDPAALRAVSTRERSGCLLRCRGIASG